MIKNSNTIDYFRIRFKWIRRLGGNDNGVVNLEEFSSISHAWMTCDPNRPGGTSGYDPNDFRHWNPKCDLDQDYDVDLVDLVIFAEDNPQNWLWVACWRLDIRQMQQQMMMSMTPEVGMQMQSVLAPTIIETMSVVPEKPIREQVLELKDTVQFLERIWLNDPSIRSEIDPTEWRQFMDKVYDGFNELKMTNTKSLDLPEEFQ